MYFLHHNNEHHNDEPTAEPDHLNEKRIGLGD